MSKSSKNKYIVMILNIIIMVCNMIVGNINSDKPTESTIESVENE